MENQTIVSQATPFGYSSIAVIRLSGEHAFLFASGLANISTPRKHLESVLLPIFDEGGKRIDSGIFTFFKNPRSYTGEDVVEISCHGNPLIVKMILNHSLFLGARLAEPGEYTKRAFLNGKMSLSQAESVGALISSKSKNAIYYNNKNIEGASTESINTIKEGLISALSAIEYELDISEEEDTLHKTVSNVVKILNNNNLLCRSLISSFDAGVAYSSGFRVVIIGRPNVGKSTLMNALVGLNRSIVSDAAGTTRDTVTHDLIIDGYPITMIDTAGVREVYDNIEAEGVQRTTCEMGRADIVLSLYSHDTKPVDNIDVKKQINVYNKADLHKNKKLSGSDICISALHGTGLEKLNKALVAALLDVGSFSGDVFINTERQKQSVVSCESSILKSLALLKKENPVVEIVAYEIKTAIGSLDSFLGKTTTDDILNKVFSSFCVGK